MHDKRLRILASIGLAVGAVCGMAGTFAPSASLRGLLWGIDGVGLVMACALLTVAFVRTSHDFVASGFLVFTIGQSLILSSAAMDLTASTPLFGAGVSLWALALVLIGLSPVFPLLVRLLGYLTALLFAITALQVFTGSQVTPLTEPLPAFGYPVLVATLVGWIWTLLRANRSLGRS